MSLTSQWGRGQGRDYEVGRGAFYVGKGQEKGPGGFLCGERAEKTFMWGELMLREGL